jgi:hypothetical protein
VTVGSSVEPGRGCGFAKDGSIEEPQRMSCQECNFPVNPERTSETCIVQFPSPEEPLHVSKQPVTGLGTNA